MLYDFKFTTDLVPHRKSMKERIKYFKNNLLLWSKTNLRNFPWRTTPDPYNVCVAEILLRQTFVKKVIPVYESIISFYPNVVELSRAELSKLEKLIYPLGLVRRAKQLIMMAEFVVNKYNGIIPADKKALMSLPGIGEYAASAILCFAYGLQFPIVDTNIIRVYTRYYGLSSFPNSMRNKIIFDISKTTLPDGNAIIFNYALLDFAAKICSHYNPADDQCPINYFCIYNKS